MEKTDEEVREEISLRVPLPPPASPLSVLKDTLYNLTGVAPQSMKLINNGAILRDELVSLATYGLVDPLSAAAAAEGGEGLEGGESAKEGFWDSWSFTSSRKRGGRRGAGVKLIMLGTTEKDQAASWARRKIPVEEEVENVPVVPETEEQLLERMKLLLGEAGEEGKLQVLGQRVTELQLLVTSPPTPDAPIIDTPADTTTEGEDVPVAPAPKLVSPTLQAAQLSETLIQTLLALDSVTIEGSFTAARAQRKEGVRRVQELLDKVDAIKEAIRAARL